MEKNPLPLGFFPDTGEEGEPVIELMTLEPIPVSIDPNELLGRSVLLGGGVPVAIESAVVLAVGFDPPLRLNEEKDFIKLLAEGGRSFSLVPSAIGNGTSDFVGDSTVALPIPEKLENFLRSDDPVEGLVLAVPGLSDEDVEGRSALASVVVVTLLL